MMAIYSSCCSNISLANWHCMPPKMSFLGQTTWKTCTVWRKLCGQLHQAESVTSHDDRWTITGMAWGQFGSGRFTDVPWRPMKSCWNGMRLITSGCVNGMTKENVVLIYMYQETDGRKACRAERKYCRAK